MSSDKKFWMLKCHTWQAYSSIGLITVMCTAVKVFVSALDRFSNLSIYSRLLDFLTILSTCRFHFKLFWTTRPQIFSDSTSLIGLPDTVRGSKDLLSLAKSIISSLHLEILCFMLLLIVQVVTSFTTS